MRRILADFRASVTSWSRSPTGVFFTIAFPLLIVVVFGALADGDSQATVLVQDNDHSGASADLTRRLNATGALDVRWVARGVDALALAADEDRHSTIIVPQGFGAAVARGGPATLSVVSDPTRSESRVVLGVLGSVVQDLNLRLSGADERIRMQVTARDGRSDGDYIDFLVPGVIGMTITTNSLIGGLEVAATLRQNGIMRKVMTTPMRKWEWVCAKALYQIFMSSIVAVVILGAGWLFYDVEVPLDWRWPLVIVASGAAFAGLAMALTRWVTKPDQANAAGSAIAFPMMFLSGTFFPLEGMPAVLRAIASVLPLTYVNEALRAAMTTGNDRLFLQNGLILLGFLVAALALGSLLVRWKED